MILVISSENYATKRLLEEAKALGIPLEVMSAEELKQKRFKINVSKYQSIYIRNPYVNGSPKYLPNIVKLAKQFNTAGKKVVDLNIAHGKLGQGKWLDYKVLIKEKIKIPITALIHGRALDKYKFPLVLKWIYGFKAKNVFFVENKDQLSKILPLHPKQEWLVQEFIKADYEYKIMTVGYKALPVVSKFGINKNGFRTDFNNHKTLKSSAFPKIIRLAEKASKALGRELAKVDVLQKGNRLYILEVNRFPGLDSFEILTKYNVTKQFIKYLSRPN